MKQHEKEIVHHVKKFLDTCKIAQKKKKEFLKDFEDKFKYGNDFEIPEENIPVCEECENYEAK